MIYREKSNYLDMTHTSTGIDRSLVHARPLYINIDYHSWSLHMRISNVLLFVNNKNKKNKNY